MCQYMQKFVVTLPLSGDTVLLRGWVLNANVIHEQAALFSYKLVLGELGGGGRGRGEGRGGEF